MEPYIRGFNEIFEEYLTLLILPISSFTLNGRKHEMTESNRSTDSTRRIYGKDNLINYQQLVKCARKDLTNNVMPLIPLISLILLLCTSTTFVNSLPLVGLPGRASYVLSSHSHIFGWRPNNFASLSLSEGDKNKTSISESPAILAEVRDMEANAARNQPLRIVDVLHGINEAAKSNRNFPLFLGNSMDDDGTSSSPSNNVQNIMMKRDDSSQKQPLSIAWRGWLRRLKIGSAEAEEKVDDGDDDGGIQVVATERAVPQMLHRRQLRQPSWSDGSKRVVSQREINSLLKQTWLG